MGPIRRAAPLRGALILPAPAQGLLAIALLQRQSTDESQYVAAAVLTSKGLLPYRDFAYLQTPLQPFVFAPLQWLFPGHLLLAVRAVNAVIGAATVMLACGAARRIGANERSALIGAAMLVTCESFAWSVGVARN